MAVAAYGGGGHSSDRQEKERGQGKWKKQRKTEKGGA